jgi:hypothetical protein
MFQKIALAATAAAFLAAAVPAEAAMPGPTAGSHQNNYTSSHVTPIKSNKKRIWVKRKVCGPVYKWRWVWWHGHLQRKKVKVGYQCHWRSVPIWRWY